jgi:3-methyladenine DNA glycosylase/8-oxoguanine DNA glycosylase
MREGERTVRVLFQYRVLPGSDRLSLEDALQRVLEQVRQDPKRTSAEIKTIRISDVFVRLFRSIFRITLTTESGWHHVAEYWPEYSGLNPDVPPDCLAIEVHAAGQRAGHHALRRRCMARPTTARCRRCASR